MIEIHMINSTHGWAKGRLDAEQRARILRTTNGGSTWADVSPALLELRTQQAYFLDRDHAWVWRWDGSAVWRTRDGGLSWTPIADVDWNAQVRFTDALRGWKLTYQFWGLTFRQFDILSFATSADGGESWQETNPPPGWGVTFMAFPDAQTAWAIRAGFSKAGSGMPNLGVPFHLHRTSDGGASWQTRTMPLPPEAVSAEGFEGGIYLSEVGNCDFDLPLYASVTLWKFALVCEERAWLYTSANQGQTWVISALPRGGEAELEFINPTVGWLHLQDAGKPSQGRLYQTTNGGQSWRLLKHTGWHDVQLEFLDEQHGWGVALGCSDGDCSRSALMSALVSTQDGGQTWQVVEARFAR